MALRNKGRSEKVLPPLRHKGTLGKGFFSKPEDTRHRILSGLAQKKGEQRVGGMMQWVSTMNKRTNPELSRKAAGDREWVNRNFDGKRRLSISEIRRRVH